jgi:hypothetical protein
MEAALTPQGFFLVGPYSATSVIDTHSITGFGRAYIISCLNKRYPYMDNLILNMPAEPAARLNYMYALASCENYHIPTLPGVTVQDMISNKIFDWYKGLVSYRSQEEVAWFSNYE